MVDVTIGYQNTIGHKVKILPVGRFKTSSTVFGINYLQTIVMEEESCLSMHVVSLDYYMLRHHKSYDFIQSSEDKVPIIRVYGSTPTGQRCVAHIHGIYPYLYFRPSNINDLTFDTRLQVDSYLLPFHKRLEEEIFKRISKPVEINGKDRKHRHIHRLEVVYKKLLYGYWPDPKFFIKVYLRSPWDVNTIVSILEVRSFVLSS